MTVNLSLIINSLAVIEDTDLAM